MDSCMVTYSGMLKKGTFMERKNVLMVMLLALLPMLMQAQVRLSGQVFDEDGKTPLPGVNILSLIHI